MYKGITKYYVLYIIYIKKLDVWHTYQPWWKRTSGRDQKGISLSRPPVFPPVSAAHYHTSDQKTKQNSTILSLDGSYDLIPLNRKKVMDYKIQTANTYVQKPN